MERPRHPTAQVQEYHRGESGGKLLTYEAAAPVKSPVPVVKAKATSLVSSLMIKHTQENLQRFENQAGLTDAGYSPHKGLSAEETHFRRVQSDGTLPKLRMPSGDFKEDRLITSAQTTPIGTPSVTPSATPTVTPCVSPHASPALSRRGWFQLSSAPFPATPELNSPNPGTDMGGNEGGGGDRWSFFGTRSVVQKSPTDPGSETSTGFSLQSYFGLQKSSTMDGTNTQVNFKVDDPANFIPPKIEITGVEAKRVPQRPHKLKPRDMNVLTPSGF
ncbi:putative monooxygenase p33MONOX isoform X2 [Pempheris klunzingeri]|uniref:putative monooxygenase p33MONOX isoform X2 n=1 Tax=Pempheris klunzingeri TaxID=3127111 RepID=UPI0039802DD8